MPAEKLAGTLASEVPLNSAPLSCTAQHSTAQHSTAQFKSIYRAWFGFTLISILALVGCGGGGGSTQTTILSGTAAVGAPIIDGAVNVTCAAGGVVTGIPNTTATGAWSVTLSGQTLPCAVQVKGGTIKGIPNTITYQSIADAYGIVNITPLTDMLVANLAGSTNPSAWFAGLTGVQLTTINQTQITTALTNLRTALALPPLNTIDPITLAFDPMLVC